MLVLKRRRSEKERRRGTLWKGKSKGSMSVFMLREPSWSYGMKRVALIGSVSGLIIEIIFAQLVKSLVPISASIMLFISWEDCGCEGDDGGGLGLDEDG